MPEFFNRCEVRDITGEPASVLFGGDGGAGGGGGGLDFGALRVGATLFVRYACKCYFSDLSTQVLKVEDLSMAKVIAAPLDVLLALSQHYYGGRDRCAGCHSALPAAGALAWCDGCHAAAYCSEACRGRHAGEHAGHCRLCHELSAVLSIDFDRYVEPVPFR